MLVEYISQGRRQGINPLRFALNGAIFLALVVACLWAWRVLEDPSRFPVREVKVRASYSHISQQALRNVILPATLASFFKINVREIQNQLHTLPWVAKARVRRVWPDSLDVQITEKVAIAQFGDNALVSAAGELFYPAPETFPQSLPGLDGPPGELALLLETQKRMNTLLKPLQLAVKELHLSPRRAWHVVLDNDTEIMLGRADIYGRLKRFVVAYPTLSKEVDIAYVDLRYSNGMAVRSRIV